MEAVKIALVSWEGPLPDWVPATFAKDNLAFVAQECTNTEQLRGCAADADVVWIFGGSRVVTTDNLPLLTRCGAIVRTGSGTDNVPVQVATQRGIIVANTPHATIESVSDHALGLMFAVMRHLGRQDRAVRRGVWSSNRNDFPLRVSGKTLGLVGFGNIARTLARKVNGLEMKVLAHDPFVKPEVMTQAGVRAATLNELLEQADIVSLHCPLTPENRHLINDQTLARMKRTAILINTSRGPVVEEAALARALAEGRIAGAGLDVLEQEPPAPNNPLLAMENVVITPHIAGYSETFIEDSWRLSVETVLALARQRWPASWVNRDVRPRWEMKG
jgi:D-3-phosphoglycerate dehydrogenase